MDCPNLSLRFHLWLISYQSKPTTNQHNKPKIGPVESLKLWHMLCYSLCLFLFNHWGLDSTSSSLLLPAICFILPGLATVPTQTCQNHHQSTRIFRIRCWWIVSKIAASFHAFRATSSLLSTEPPANKPKTYSHVNKCRNCSKCWK